MSTLWCGLSSISSANHGIRWFWRGCCAMWHAQTMQVSISWHLPEEAPVDPQGSLSCSAPSCGSCAPRRYGEVLSCTWFRKPGSFFSVSRQGPCFTAVNSKESWMAQKKIWILKSSSSLKSLTCAVNGQYSEESDLEYCSYALLANWYAANFQSQQTGTHQTGL